MARAAPVSCTMLTASVLSTLSQKPSLAATTNRSLASSALAVTSGSAVNPSAFRSASPNDLQTHGGPSWTLL